MRCVVTALQRYLFKQGFSQSALFYCNWPSVLVVLVLLLFSEQDHSVLATPQAEIDALTALYTATGGNYWRTKTLWLQGDPCESSTCGGIWSGMSCTGDSPNCHIASVRYEQPVFIVICADVFSF